MLTKTSKNLFWNRYSYKIVLVCAGARWFRSNNLDQVYKDLLDCMPLVNKKETDHTNAYWITKIKTHEELDYCFKIHDRLSKMQDYFLRVESPWLTIYSNTKKDIDALSKIDSKQVKYVCIPPENTELEVGTVIMSKTNFDYKVTLGKTKQSYEPFVSWVDSNKKLKLTNSCRRDLAKSSSFGGTHFFVTGDKNLMLAKVHLGGAINKVERIVKQSVAKS